MVVLMVMAMGVLGAKFEVPTKTEREEAVGSLRGLDAELARSFRDGGDFEEKREPGLGDWLNRHEEAGQTYGQYLRSGANKPMAGGRSKLYILPLGEFEREEEVLLLRLEAYLNCFYYPMKTEVLRPEPEVKFPRRARMNEGTGKQQWYTRSILGWLWTKLPPDAYGMLGVTMEDLYPSDTANYVFGQASYKSRVGVFSFARYDPQFFDRERSENFEDVMLRRSGKVLTHEMGHMFGIKHCIHYECNMNGVNHLREADRAPMHLCPVCLRKLHSAIRFDPTGRYELLKEFYEKTGLEEEREWVEKRIKWIGSGR